MRSSHIGRSIISERIKYFFPRGWQSLYYNVISNIIGFWSADTVIKTTRTRYLPGLQLLCTHSEENDTACLIYFLLRGKWRSFQPGMDCIRYHIWSWNQIESMIIHPGCLQHWMAVRILVHSYYAELNLLRSLNVNMKCPLAIIEKDNFFCYPVSRRKVGTGGLKILEAFLKI